MRPTAKAPIFRARLVGPIVTLLSFDRQDDGDYVGRYRLTEPGVYHAELLLLYSDFDRLNFSASAILPNVPPALYNYTFTVSSPSPPSFDQSDCASPELKYNAGHWALSGNETLLNLLKCTFYMRPGDASCYILPPPLISQATEWILPNEAGIKFNYLCPIHDYRFDPAPVDCLDGLKVCFFGDSHLRYLHNSLVMLFHPGTQLTEHHQILEDGVFSYELKEWHGFPFDMEERLVANCTHVFVNWGQWAASRIPGRPWSFEKYRQFLETDLEILRYLKDVVSTKIYWMATNPVGFIASDDWRTDPVMDEYVAIARNATVWYGVTLVDAYDMAKTVDDLSYYGGHYVGAVGRELMNVVLNELCNSES